MQRAAGTAVNTRTQIEGRAEALVVDGLAIVECVVAADELPNIPHIEFDLASHFAIAKVKEAVIAVTGR
jgi:pyruvate dehydrogenase (quinone)